MENRNIGPDLKKLADLFFHELMIVNIEYGGIGLDPKRPFGNSDVEADILEILDISGDDWVNGYDEFSDAQRLYARTLYHEKLIPYLKRRWKELP